MRKLTFAMNLSLDVTPAEIEFAGRWRDMPKVVFSSTTSTVDWNTRLVAGDAVTEITRLEAEDGGPMGIAGATLAAAAMRAGLIDEYVLVTSPVLVGGGAPFFTGSADHAIAQVCDARGVDDPDELERAGRSRCAEQGPAATEQYGDLVDLELVQNTCL